VGDGQRTPWPELLDRAREQFDTADDLTVAVEEEFALLEPQALALAPRFDDLQSAARGTALEPHLVGELISSEVEIRTGRCETFVEVAGVLSERRRQLFELAEPLGVALGATGTHPWSPWQEQQIIDTDHYREVQDQLQYVAWRNNTFSVHVHVGVNGAERAVRVCDRLRSVMPELLAISANSPFLDGRPNGYLSYRSEIWLDTDRNRTGMLPFAFEPGMGFERYADYALDVPMYFVYRDGRYIDVAGASFRDFLHGRLAALPRERPTLDDWADHLTTLFPDVRLKHFLEMRGADAGGKTCSQPPAEVARECGKEKRG